MIRSRGAVSAAAALLTVGCVGLKECAYVGWGRDGWQEPERVVQALDIVPGARVADLGSGTGYFTFRLADATGEEGRVYAVDIDEQLVEYLAERAREEGYSQVEVVQAEPDDAKLPDGGVDLVFTCNTYHHIGERDAYFRRLRDSLRPGGRVAIVELRPAWYTRFFPHATSSDLIEQEMADAGYRLVERHDWLSRQHFLVFSLG